MLMLMEGPEAESLAVWRQHIEEHIRRAGHDVRFETAVGPAMGAPFMPSLKCTASGMESTLELYFEGDSVYLELHTPTWLAYGKTDYWAPWLGSPSGMAWLEALMLERWSVCRTLGPIGPRRLRAGRKMPRMRVRSAAR